VLGDYGPFSRIGKSIGYQVTVGGKNFLVDCGSPVFQKIGGHGLKNIHGLIITHCHDDHKRWFTDFALFTRYAPDIDTRIPLLTSHEVNQGLAESSEAALGTSLSSDSRRVIDIGYEEYVDFRAIAPRARYRIERQLLGAGRFQYRVVDEEGAVVGPERAKIVFSPKNITPRLLFRDPATGEWVEPINYYAFSDRSFYGENPRYEDPAGFTIEAINAPVWHGLPNIGLRFSTATESVVFSSDTNSNRDLWAQLCHEKMDRQGLLQDRMFQDAAIISGDINDYVERVWSETRYREAMTAFADGIVFHDIALRKSVVHTDYRDLARTTLDQSRTVLTHSPDKMTSQWMLCEAEKVYRVEGDLFREVVGRELLPIQADFFHKEGGHYYVCFRDETSEYAIFERDGILFLSTDPFRGEGRLVCHVAIYEDIGGAYFPKLADEQSCYRRRPDGRVEQVTFTDDESRGELVADHRPRLTRH
jgi:ribonuclease BN (tRNA processing enzyme)